MKALKFLGVAVLACSMLFVSCKKDYTITVKADPVEGGTVTGGGSYAANATATLTATANAGYEFTGWSDGTTNNPRTITVTKSETYTAKFQAIAAETINVTFDGNTKWTADNSSQYTWSLYYPYQSYNLCQYQVVKSDNEDYPYADGMFLMDMTKQASTGLNYFKETGYYLFTQDPTTGEITDTVLVGDYAWLNSEYNDPYTLSNLAFDATSLKTSFNLNIPMIDIDKRFSTPSQTIVKNVAIDYYNVTLQEDAKQAIKTKKTAVSKSFKLR